MAKFIRIAAQRDGYRRCGIAHGKAAVDHPIDRFTAAQLAALKADPHLVAVEVETAPQEPTTNDDPQKSPIEGEPAGGAGSPDAAKPKGKGSAKGAA